MLPKRGLVGWIRVVDDRNLVVDIVTPGVPEASWGLVRLMAADSNDLDQAAPSSGTVVGKNLTFGRRKVPTSQL
jgi:hypothetical protein